MDMIDSHWINQMTLLICSQIYDVDIVAAKLLLVGVKITLLKFLSKVVDILEQNLEFICLWM